MLQIYFCFTDSNDASGEKNVSINQHSILFDLANLLL